MDWKSIKDLNVLIPLSSRNPDQLKKFGKDGRAMYFVRQDMKAIYGGSLLLVHKKCNSTKGSLFPVQFRLPHFWVWPAGS